jgi:pimeloyl-ACP methyl ester carboxylesterase
MAQWHDFRLDEFNLDTILPDKICGVKIVYPEHAVEGSPWVWRAEFFDSFTSVDLDLVRKGWHVAYCCLSDMYGAPAAIEAMKRFHSYAVQTLGFSPKPAVFGFSRGGLYTVNYAYAHPEDNCCLYLDAPCLDIRNWPAGLNRYPRSETEWAQCRLLYGLTDDSIKDYHDSPLNHAPALAKRGIPVILVAGDADELVYYPENGEIFEKRYRENGGPIKVILKPGGRHHPHSLEDPREITAFILGCWDTRGRA